MRRHLAMTLCLATAVIAMSAIPASASPVPTLASISASRDHCSITVTGQRPSGELITTAPRCFATQAEVLNQASAALANVLAIHYKQTGYNGPSLTINGSSCTGGYVNLQGSLASWRNAIVSTRNVDCAVTRHWSGFNKTGSVDVHYAWEVNLGSLIGNVSSASYHAS
jgi:hypothetical protein